MQRSISLWGLWRVEGGGVVPFRILTSLIGEEQNRRSAEDGRRWEYFFLDINVF